MILKMLLGVVIVLAGASGASQAAANAGLASRAGISVALMLNGIVVMTGATLFFVAAGGYRTAGAAWGAPLPYYIGGFCGLFIIAALTFSVPRLGAAVSMALMVLGQGAMALVIDHFGLWGMRVAPLSATRLLGVVLLVAGMLLMRR
jgi:transporter family-2 protein